MSMVLEVDQEKKLEQKAIELLEFIKDHKVLAFYGEMGAGKTTFIKAILKHLGVADSMSSPTFSIVNEYALNSGKKAYHFDFYRIKNLNEAFDMGYENYFYSGDYCFIEWPEKVEELLPKNHVKITINLEKEKRIIKITTV